MVSASWSNKGRCRWELDAIATVAPGYDICRRNAVLVSTGSGSVESSDLRRDDGSRIYPTNIDCTTTLQMPSDFAGEIRINVTTLQLRGCLWRWVGLSYHCPDYLQFNGGDRLCSCAQLTLPEKHANTFYGNVTIVFRATPSDSSDRGVGFTVDYTGEPRAPPFAETSVTRFGDKAPVHDHAACARVRGRKPAAADAADSASAPCVPVRGCDASRLAPDGRQVARIVPAGKPSEPATATVVCSSGRYVWDPARKANVTSMSGIECDFASNSWKLTPVCGSGE